MALALDEPKDTDTKAEEKGYSFCIEPELLEQVAHVTVDFTYMGFSVEAKNPIAGSGGGCGGCSASGGCGTSN